MCWFWFKMPNIELYVYCSPIAKRFQIYRRDDFWGVRVEPRCVDVRRVLQHGRRRHRRRRRRRLRLRRHRPDPDGAVTRGGKQEAVSVPVQVINGAFVAFQGHFKNPCCCNEQQFWLLTYPFYILGSSGYCKQGWFQSMSVLLYQREPAVIGTMQYVKGLD